MTHDTDDGKGFAPDEHADDEHAASTTHGSGKSFAEDVDDPDTDTDATTSEGSGKQFSPSVEDPEDETTGGRGSGKQFEPGRHEL